MNREDVDKLALGKSGKISSGKPTDIQIMGLPPHLEAEINFSQMLQYRYRLTRTGDPLPYQPHQGWATPEAALQELKKLLNWDPA
jgi:hypothetical protein